MWLHIPYECSPSAPVTEGSTLPSDSFFLELSRSVTSSAKFHAPEYWRLAWRKGHSSPLRSGLTFPPSTEPDGLDAWISLWRDSPVSLIPSQASEKAQPMPDGRSGMISSASRVNAQLELFSLRTSPDCSVVPEVNPSPASAPIWTVQALRFKPPASWVLAMSGHPTEETGSSSWPTTRTCETPGGLLREQNGQALSAEALTWPTPSTSNSTGAGTHGDGGMNLQTSVVQWPTPTVNGNHNVKGMSPTSGDGLETSVKQWPTPASRDWRDGRSHLMGTNARPLNEVATAFSHPDLTPTGQPSIQDSGPRQLNPRFVEWMMGLPDGWTSLVPRDSEPLAMELCHYKQQ